MVIWWRAPRVFAVGPLLPHPMHHGPRVLTLMLHVRGPLYVAWRPLHVSMGPLHVAWRPLHVSVRALHVTWGPLHVSMGSLHVT